MCYHTKSVHRYSRSEWWIRYTGSRACAQQAAATYCWYAVVSIANEEKVYPKTKKNVGASNAGPRAMKRIYVHQIQASIVPKQ